ncbi:unnamed protein product [Sphagnum jensenii]|uniref:Uncharacterized protein n=1 Tax=Sphagnum jensenii TaxID=128206 RepID=A0ABP0WX33_9BRYO
MMCWTRLRNACDDCTKRFQMRCWPATAYDELCGKGRRGGVMECTLRASETHESFRPPAVVVRYALSFHFKAKLQRKSRSYKLN